METRDDVKALDRTLEALGHADGPSTSRNLARDVPAPWSDDVHHRKLLGEVVERVSEAPRARRDEGRARLASLRSPIPSAF